MTILLAGLPRVKFVGDFPAEVLIPLPTPLSVLGRTHRARHDRSFGNDSVTRTLSGFRFGGRSESLLSQDRRWGDGNAESCSLDLLGGGLSSAIAFSVHCRIYRPVAGAVEELFSQTLELRISDTLDRTRPYVQWAHDVHCEVFETLPDGSRVRTGWHHEDRRSDIHRTDVPGRRRMVARHTRKATMQYLDALPFPHADIVANRAQLCDLLLLRWSGQEHTAGLSPRARSWANRLAGEPKACGAVGLGRPHLRGRGSPAGIGERRIRPRL